MDVFGPLPDQIILEILNRISDVKTLVRLAAVSKRFHSLVPHADLLSLRIDRLDSPAGNPTLDTVLITFFKSILKSLQEFLFLFPRSARPGRVSSFPNPPIARILSGFEWIRQLEIQLPGGDMRLEEGSEVRWKAEFGRTLRSCVILGFRSGGGSSSLDCCLGGDVSQADIGRGLKTRVVWTINALVGASARHHLIRDVIKRHEGMEKLVMRDREREGVLVMDAEGLKEAREEMSGSGHDAEACGTDGCRTVVPSVSMTMRHIPKLTLNSGACWSGATLVVVRPTGNKSEPLDDAGDAGIAYAAFGGDRECREAVAALLGTKSYLLEMNAF